MQTHKNNTAVAGIAGAVIGAGITAAAVALSDKDTRKKVTARIMEVKKQAEKVMTDTSKKAEEAGHESEKVIDDQKSRTEDLIAKTEGPAAL